MKLFIIAASLSMVVVTGVTPRPSPSDIGRGS
jgi:hypothetical protein